MGKIILVLGCHRSGTSLVAKSMECLGAELGTRAHWGAADNPDFCEDLDVLAVCEDMLGIMRTTWDDPSPWEPEKNVQIMRGVEYVAGLVRWRMAHYPVWAVKNPRICRLLPFWRKVFEESDAEVSVVNAVRHPMEVAMSLQKRNGLPIERGLDLWLEYVRRAALDADPSWKSVTVCHDIMMALPGVQIERMGARLGLPVSELKAKAFVLDFMKVSLWHETADQDVSLPLPIATTWARMRKEALT